MDRCKDAEEKLTIGITNKLKTESLITLLCQHAHVQFGVQKPQSVICCLDAVHTMCLVHPQDSHLSLLSLTHYICKNIIRGHRGIFGLKAVLLNSVRMIATLTLSHLDQALEQLTTQMRTRQSLAITDPMM